MPHVTQTAQATKIENRINSTQHDTQCDVCIALHGIESQDNGNIK